jgi:filamentous hemagglutinin family protein
MKIPYFSILPIYFIAAFDLIWNTAAFGQTIVPDNSLGTVVKSANGLDFAITQGTQSGSNLFHSFRSFSVPNQGSATFDLTGKTGISSIFSRVTGTDLSNINGVIQSKGGNSPNLFLMNPNGIVFGPGARLNAIGAFTGTTATGIQFKDTIFAADPNQPLPLLSIHVPIGVQMGATSGTLTVNGTGNDAIFPTNNLGLMGTPGRSIALVGSTVNLNRGVVTAPAGRLDMGAVRNGVVKIETTPIGFALTYGTGLAFGDVNLAARSSLWTPDPVGNPFGGIQVVGNNITIDQSQIAAATVGRDRGGDITVRASGTLTLKGVDPLGLAPTWIVNQIAPGAAGDSGTITVNAGRINLLDGSAIESLNAGQGSSGLMTVNAETIDIQGNSPIMVPFRLGPNTSSIVSTVIDSGKGGNIHLDMKLLNLSQSGTIASVVFPFAQGQGGSIQIQGERINANDSVPNVATVPSGILLITTGTGNGGNLDVKVNQLQLVDGGNISSFVGDIPGLSNSGTGNAGTVTVNADRIEILGTNSQTHLGSSLASTTTGSGTAGNLNILANDILITDGGNLNTGTTAALLGFGDPDPSRQVGNSGNLRVATQTLTVIGRNPYVDDATSLGTYAYSSGNAGNASIDADRINLYDGGVIFSSTVSSGNAGSVDIRARDILISGRSSNGRASSIASSGNAVDQSAQVTFGVPAIPTGNTGMLKVTADRITLQDGGNISVKHEGLGNAGDLKINVNALTLSRDAEIVGSTLTGKGGNADIQVRDVLLLRDQSTISVSSAGTGNGGNIVLNAGLIIGINNSDIIANANQGNGGNIQLTTQALIGITPRRVLTPDSDITASSGFGLDGTIAVQTLSLTPQTVLPILNSAFTDANQQVTNVCANVGQSQFISTGRGGIPRNPIQSLKSQRSWQDLRSTPLMTTQIQPMVYDRSEVIAPNLSARSPVIEATAWTIGPDRQVELVAQATPKHSIVATCALAPIQANR